MIVTKEGIQLFEWTDISKKTDVIAENTKLLTFDEIKEKLADHLLYAQIANLGGISPEGFANIYTVKNVQLRAANINAYNKPKRSWLVPVWVFDVEGKMQHKTGEGDKYEKSYIQSGSKTGELFRRILHRYIGFDSSRNNRSGRPERRNGGD